jgi:AraC-like DNA-binding protein
MTNLKCDEAHAPLADAQEIAHPAYARALLWYLRSQGVSMDERHSPTLTEQTLKLEEVEFLSLREVEWWIEWAHALTGDMCLGWEVGFRSELSSHGSVGFAAMSAPDVAQLLKMVVRFAPLREKLLQPRLRERENGVTMTFDWADCLWEVAENHLVKIYVQSQFTAALVRLLGAATGQAVGAHLSLDWPFSREKWGRLLEPVFATVRYEAEKWCLFISQDGLSLPCLGGDAAAFQTLVQECESVLEKMRVGGLTVRIFTLFAKDFMSYQYVAATASALHMSERTLIRRLKEQGLTFTELRDRYRLERIAWYLKNTNLPMAEVAYRVGFQDTSNFSRAFRRLSGLGPLDYRRTYANSSD